MTQKSLDNNKPKPTEGKGIKNVSQKIYFYHGHLHSASGILDAGEREKANKECKQRYPTPSPLDEIEKIEIETDLSTGKKYMDGLKLSQVDEILINKINLMILFINSKQK